MFKKILSTLFAATILTSALVGCNNTTAPQTSSSGAPVQADKSDKSNPYAEHLSFKVFSIDGTETMMEYPLVAEACEKFNFDFEVQLVAWDNWDEVTRVLAATDSFPEVIAWYNLGFAEYFEWVNEGVFKALPSDMSAYPNLKNLMDNYSIFNKLKIDNQLYAFPKIKNNNPYNEYESYMFAYRRDWAKQMGLDYAPVEDMTYAEFVDFLKLVKEKDPGKLGDKLVPLDFDNGGNSWVGFAKKWNPNIQGYAKVDGKYQWGAPDATSYDALNQIKSLYDGGLLAKDSYSDSNNAGRERFLAGRSAVLYGNLGPAILIKTAAQLAENVPGFKDEDMGLITLKMDDGKYHVSQMDEWWGAFAFDSSCRDSVMERWLAVGNWALEQEQVEKYAYGVPGEDWTKAADGTVTLNYTAEDSASGGKKSYITTQRTFQKYFILEGLDVFLKGNPTSKPYIIEDLFKTNMETWAKNPYYTPNNYDVAFFSAPNKDAFNSVLGEGKGIFIQSVLSDDPKAIWDKYVSTNMAKSELAAEDLNKEFKR